MVKIVNTLGEVKKGVQGEAVYQGRYGQQIRRSLKPKRAIPSETQLQHRQLYRDALTWRKSLPLANRRFLDGYCIKSWVVDRYHLPLPWHRFALKLYLEHVHFVLEEKPIASGADVHQKKQSYVETPNWNPTFGGDAWKAETFLTTDAYTITSVKFKLLRYDYPGTITASIRDTLAGKPTGADLTAGTTDGDTLPEAPDWEMREIILTPYQLQAAHLYAIVIRRATSYPPANATPAGRNDAPLYADGMFCYSDNAGSTWKDYGDGVDMMFETWTLAPGTPGVPGLLHVRHSALLTVIHKRGELTITEYDNLSSLDKQYLTKLVKLAIEAGDLIEVTTVTGRHFTHQLH